MAKKYTYLQIKTDRDNNVHPYYHNGLTVCGLEADGDSGLGIKTGIPVNKKITCKDCIDIIEHCKGINKNKYN